MAISKVMPTASLISAHTDVGPLRSCFTPDIPLAAGNVTKESLNLSSNIRTVDWAPQTDVLGHPNVKAFITQGGINSLYEAMHNAVPVGIIPLLADQPFNLRQVTLTF